MANLGLSLGLSWGGIASKLPATVSAATNLPVGTTIDVDEADVVTVTIPSGVYQGTHTTTLAALPVFLTSPVINETGAIEGDDLSVTDGLLIYDGSEGTPVIVTSWFVDGALVNTTGLDMPAGSVVARQRATIGGVSVTADSVAETVASGRTIADVAADNADADYFDFGNINNLWADIAKTTPISDDVTLIDYIDGETGVLNLRRDTSRHRPTFDSTYGGINWTNNGNFQWMVTGTTTIGPALTIVSRIRADNVAAAAQLIHYWTGGTDKIFLHGYTGGGLARLAVRNNANSQFVLDDTESTLSSGVDHTLTTVLANDGSVTIRVDGVVVHTGTVTTPLKTMTAQIRIGGSNSQSGGWSGRMRRAFILPTAALSGADLEIVEAWVGATT